MPPDVRNIGSAIAYRIRLFPESTSLRKLLYDSFRKVQALNKKYTIRKPDSGRIPKHVTMFLLCWLVNGIRCRLDYLERITKAPFTLHRTAQNHQHQIRVCKDWPITSSQHFIYRTIDRCGGKRKSLISNLKLADKQTATQIPQAGNWQRANRLPHTQRRTISGTRADLRDVIYG